jgi:hypothetical protein
MLRTTCQARFSHISLRPILILSSHLHIGLENSLFPSLFALPKALRANSHFPNASYMPHISQPPFSSGMYNMHPECCSQVDSTPPLYLGGPRFNSENGNQKSRLDFCGFPQPSRQMLRSSSYQTTTASFLIHYLLNHLIIWQMGFLVHMIVGIEITVFCSVTPCSLVDDNLNIHWHYTV